ncbi:MAG: Ig-like domain-containing protein [Ignavibacteriales bacterium]|nr:Ig-like domain-containing protein [Ignavibacteriales bacterium]
MPPLRFLYVFYKRVLSLVVLTLFASTAHAIPPDTLNGSNAYGAFFIVRTDTSFSGTVCTGQVTVDGTYDADSVYLTRIQLDSSDFRTHISYLPGDTLWGNAVLLISSFCKSLIDIDLALAQKGIQFPSGLLSLFQHSGTGTSAPICWPPVPPEILNVQFYYGSLNGSLVVETGCMAILAGAITDFTTTLVEDGGIVFSATPPNPLVPALKSSEVLVSGSVYLAGSVDADSVYLDGSFLGATLQASSLQTKTLELFDGEASFTEAVNANKVGFLGSTGRINLSGNSSLGAGSLETPKLTSSGSSMSVNGLLTTDHLSLFGSNLTAGNLSVPLVYLTGSTASVINTTMLDSLSLNNSTFSGGLSMTAKKVSGSNSELNGTLIQVKQSPTLIDLNSSQINAGTLDADFMYLDTCSTSFGTLVTMQTIANNSSFDGGLLNARTGRSLFYLNNGIVQSSHINAGTYHVRNVTTITPFMEGDTLLTWGGSVYDAAEDSVRIHFLHRSFIDSTLVKSDVIYASLAQAEVTQGSRFESDRRGDGPRQEEISFPGEMNHKPTGASYGGYGGTNGNLNVNAFIPADDPVGVPNFAPEDLRKGLGGFGWTSVQHSEGGVGGGRIRIDASSLVWNGFASVNGGNAERPIPLGYNGGGGGGGGTGGTIYVDVSGAFSGSGRIESNGGNGAYSFGGDLSFQTGSGGSGGRIRINYGALGVWNGMVKALGGVGGTFDTASISYYPGFVTPWIDSLNNGGPGTIYWKQNGGSGRILIDGEGGPGGVGRIDGSYPQDTLEVRGALAVTNGLQLRGLKLTDGGILRADNPRVRLRWPAPVLYGISPLFDNPGLYNSSQTVYPVWVWQDSLSERLTIETMNDVFIDASSRLDVSGQGGYSQTDADFSSGGWGNRAGGSHGGYGGWGRWGSEQQMGKPNAVKGNPLQPEEVGEGGYGVRKYSNTPHNVAILGGMGGGALRLMAGGTVRVDGLIVSNGGRGNEDTPNADGQGTGGGSGGSVWITASSLEGSGMISASGGDGSFDSYYQLCGGGGGGGRIRIDYASKGSWSGDVRTFGGRGGQQDTSHHGIIPWTNPRVHGGAGTIYWNESSAPTLEVRNFAPDSGGSALSGAFSNITLLVHNALLATDGLAVGALRLENQAVLTADDNRNTLYSFPGFFSSPTRFPFWSQKTPKFIALDIKGNALIDATSRIDVSGLGGFSRVDENTLSGAALNPAGGSYGGVGGGGRVASLFGVASPVFGDSLRPLSAGLGGFGDDALPGSGIFFYQCRSSGSGGAALRMSVGGTLDLHGIIRSNGFSGTALFVCNPDNNHTPTGGAGGSIFLAAGQLTGAGLLDASGGDGVFNSDRWGGGGGGGRIAVYGTLASFSGTMRANGGLGGAGGGVDSLVYKGGPGTIVTGSVPSDAAIPFTVVGTSVADGDTGVSRTEPLFIVFNKPARISSLQMSSTPDPGGLTMRGNFAGDSVWLDHSELAEQTTYTVRLVQLLSMFGDTLAANSPRQWTFSTGEVITKVGGEELVPLEFVLYQNYPNPFNPLTIVDFTMEKEDRVSLRIYNILGELITTLVDESRLPGKVYHVTFDGTRLPSGLYFARLESGGKQLVRKMLLVK